MPYWVTWPQRHFEWWAGSRTKSVIILIGNGSMHNLMQAHLVRSLGLTAQPTHPFRIVVGNGNEVVCHQMCVKVMVNIQD